MRARMLDFEAINRLIGTPEMLAQGRTYAGKLSDDDEAERQR